MILRSFKWLILGLFVYAVHGQDPEDENDDETAHFSDPKGRLSWVIDDTSLPWVGSYNFLGSSISHSTVLLSVFDSSTGIKLAECHTSTQPGFTAIPPMQPSHSESWQKIVFGLHPDVLHCNITADGEHFDSQPIKIPPTNLPRSFSVRILADRGPKCIKGLIVQNEQPNGCPPMLKRNNFSSRNFECGCSESMPNQWNAKINPINLPTMSMPQEIKTTSAVEFPLFELTTEEGEEEDHPILFTKSPPHPSDAAPRFSSLKIHSLPPNPTTTQASTPSPATFIVTSHPCSSYSCQNNGTCILDMQSQPHCICKAGFTGEHCETDVCAAHECQNGGRCHVFEGQPVCQCPNHTTGAHCEQVLCEQPCQNGGQCVFMGGRAMCQCLKGFIGGNCNVRDVCQNATICAIFGAEARCQLEPESYGLSPNETIDAEYDCHCLDEKHEWVKCLDLALARQAAQATATPSTTPTTTTIIQTTATLPTTTSTSPETEATSPMILLVPSSTVPPPIAPVDPKDNQKTGFEKKEEKQEIGTPFQANRKHPSGTNLTAPTEMSEEIKSEEIASPETIVPEFPLTNIPESKEIVSSETPSMSTPTGTPVFNKLPDLTPVFTLTGEETTPPTDYEEEEEGDNGFEKITQIIPGSGEFNRYRTSTEGAPAFPTFKPSTPRLYPTSSKSVEIGEAGEPVTSTPKDYEGNGIEEEVITEEPTAIPEEPHTTPEEVVIGEETTHPSLVINKGEVDFSGENARTNQMPTRNRESSTAATTLSWIIAIGAIVSLMLIIAGSGLFVLRYVKRSRRLHGKYNPAREENMVASTYSMPMTSVSKEERLI